MIQFLERCGAPDGLREVCHMAVWEKVQIISFVIYIISIIYIACIYHESCLILAILDKAHIINNGLVNIFINLKS